MIHLSVQNLGKSYGKHKVFKNLSFRAGSIPLGIAGPNGSGKSTLLKCLAGILKPTAGSVEWRKDGEPMSNEHLKEILGFAAPYIQLYDELTVTENIRFIEEVRRFRKAIEIADILESVGAAGFADSFYGDLSTGQQQRVKLAAATAHQPAVLFLDEPGANLDTPGKKIVERIVARYKRESKMVILASNQKEELKLCDEIIELEPASELI